MDNQSMATNEQVPFQFVNVDSEIEQLARETRMPRDLVAKIYVTERTQLERTARIKTYVPVLTHRRVKAVLREQTCA
jgi:Protein of unknown function (DUF3562)